MSQLREDFEKAKQDAYKKYRWEIRTGICDEMFLWAARWMAERCADEVLISSLTKIALAGELRKMAQDLE